MKRKIVSYSILQEHCSFYLCYSHHVKLPSMKESDEFLEIEPEWSDQFSLTIQRMRTCYKITPKFKNYVHQRGQVGKIVITVDEAVDLKTVDKVLETTKFSKFVIYLSSEAASFGIESGGGTFDGEPFMTELRLETQKAVAIKPKKSVYLKDKTNCSQDSYYELLEAKFVSEANYLCPLPCTPLGTPNRTMKKCIKEENQVSL